MSELINTYADFNGVRRIHAFTDGSIVIGIRCAPVVGQSALRNCGPSPAEQAIELAHILQMSEDLGGECRKIIGFYKDALRSALCGRTEADRTSWVFHRLAGKHYRPINGRKSCYQWVSV